MQLAPLYNTFERGVPTDNSKRACPIFSSPNSKNETPSYLEFSAGESGRRVVEFLSISGVGSRSIQSSIRVVIVFSLEAAYKRNLFNLLSDILKFNLLNFTSSTRWRQ